MILPRKYLPINWTGSMKFSEAHFIENEQSIYDAIRDAISLSINTYNYGVLPPFVGQNRSIDIQINQRSGSDQFVQIILNGLNAVTSGGLRISINPKYDSEAVVYTHSFATEAFADTRENTQFFDVVLRVIPEERVPLGDPDPEEVPPRVPYIGPKYVLNVVPANQGNSDGANHLVVGRIVQYGDQFLVDEKYIPPCTALISHPSLLQYYRLFGDMLGALQADSLKIVGKIQLRHQHPGLSGTIEKLCREMLSYIADIQFEYQNMVRQQPPIAMIGCFSTFASRMLVVLNCFTTVEREELLNYFYQWVDITPGNFGSALAQCAGIIYQHQNCYQSVELVAQFLDILTVIWKRLGLLEYIGQRKDNIIITEQSERRFSSGIRQQWKTID